MTEAPKRRASDRLQFWSCWLARRASEAWDFIDKRNIDQHAMAWMVAWCGWDIANWAMDFYEAHPDKSGSEMALVIAAVAIPYTAFAGAVTKWYFTRQDS